MSEKVSPAPLSRNIKTHVSENSASCWSDSSCSRAVGLEPANAGGRKRGFACDCTKDRERSRAGAEHRAQPRCDSARVGKRRHRIHGERHQRRRRRTIEALARDWPIAGIARYPVARTVRSMSVRGPASAFLACVATSLSGCASEPLVISDASEIASHRSMQPIVRGADQCVDEISRMQEVGYGDHASITLRIDRSGNARFVSVQTPAGRLVNLASDACQEQIASQMGSWQYRPFERDGRAVEAEIVERVCLCPLNAGARHRASFQQYPTRTP